MSVTDLLGKTAFLLDAYKVLMLPELSLTYLKQKKSLSQPYFLIIVIVSEFSLERSDQYKCIYYLLSHFKDNSHF